MAVTTEISLDLTSPKQYIYIRAKQGDLNSREIAVTLTNNFIIYTLPPTAKANIRYVKPDGNIVNNQCTISNNKIIVRFTEQMLIVEGIAECEINVIDSATNSSLTSVTFNVLVDKSVFCDTTIKSTSEFTALSEALLKVEQMGNAITYCQTTTTEAIRAMDGIRNEYVALKAKCESLIAQMENLINASFH